MIPDEVKTKLESAHTDVEVCKLLSENDIDLEAIEKTKNDHGFDPKKISYMDDKELDTITGGFVETEHADGHPVTWNIACAVCRNENRNDFSEQFWTALFSKGISSYYRCKICNTLYVRTTDYNISWDTSNTYPEYRHLITW